jgi:peptide/nickel transport system substrate-binding protein
MVYDTLFATDAAQRVHPQMVEAWEVAADGLAWTFRLRPGLRFHDGEPVLARDCVASLRRWGTRDGLGQMVMAATQDLLALDDQTFAFRLRRPMPILVDALGKASSAVPFMMPERLASVSPATQLREAVGSGPFRFLPDEWRPGSGAAFARFASYVPRNEPPNGAAGGKVVHVDRVEWHILPDPATAAAALQRAEVDWYEQSDLELIPLPRATRGVVVDAFADGFAAVMRFNQLHPPFDNPKVRRAVLAAVDQQDYLMTMAPQPDQRLACASFFFCGTPMATDAGAGAMAADLARARALLAASGYGGEKAVIISAADIPWLHAVSAVMEDLLRKLGMTVELAAMDLGTFFARRNSPEPVERGGWSVFHTGIGSVDVLDPASHLALRGNGRAGWVGWPADPELEAMRLEWMASISPPPRAAIAARMQRRAFETVPYVPLGIRRTLTAYRQNISGLQKGSAPFAWNIRKG